MSDELKPASIVVPWQDKRLEQAFELIESVAGEWNSDQDGIGSPLRFASAMVEMADCEIEQIWLARASMWGVQA